MNWKNYLKTKIILTLLILYFLCAPLNICTSIQLFGISESELSITYQEPTVCTDCEMTAANYSLIAKKWGSGGSDGSVARPMMEIGFQDSGYYEFTFDYELSSKVVDGYSSYGYTDSSLFIGTKDPNLVNSMPTNFSITTTRGEIESDTKTIMQNVPHDKVVNFALWAYADLLNTADGSFYLKSIKKLDSEPQIVAIPFYGLFNGRIIKRCDSFHLFQSIPYKYTIPLMIINGGPINLDISSINLNKIVPPYVAPFDIQYNDCDSLLGYHQNCLINVDYNPDKPGLHFAVLEITSNDPDYGILRIPLLGWTDEINECENEEEPEYKFLSLDEFTYKIQQGQIVKEQILTDKQYDFLIISRAIAGSDVEMELTLPGGEIVNRQTVKNHVEHILTDTFEYYKIKQPALGQWTITLTGTDVPIDGEDTILMIAALKRQIRLPFLPILLLKD